MDSPFGYPDQTAIQPSDRIQPLPKDGVDPNWAAKYGSVLQGLKIGSGQPQSGQTD